MGSVTKRDHAAKREKTSVSRAKTAPRQPRRDARDVTASHGPRGGVEARLEAARLHAEGISVSEIGRQIGVARETVSRWIHHRAATAVAVERAARAETFADAVSAARERLRAGASRAAEVLVAQLDSSDPAVAAAAARTLLDRVGVPRAEVVQTVPAPLDLSGLATEELEHLEGLLARAGGAS